jgi:hypothetical protein
MAVCRCTPAPEISQVRETRQSVMAFLAPACARPVLTPCASRRPHAPLRAVSGMVPARNCAALTSRAHLAGTSNLTLRPVAKVRAFRSPVAWLQPELPALHMEYATVCHPTRRAAVAGTKPSWCLPLAGAGANSGDRGRRGWVSKHSSPVQSSPVQQELPPDRADHLLRASPKAERNARRR